MAGVQVGALIGGSVIVESVFAWPGLGMLAFESLFARLHGPTDGGEVKGRSEEGRVGGRG